ncbi:macrolide transport system ATP-binding/permease protein [Chitinasiproducens palmae]|uniref:Macrolide transport system ATP-binding/permease protein n=1 Tax=Chitinasiproducens palmae TaxID=1770053 RepID=A0A1H2PMS5_9BURK|nr:macrolide transport system ATP-binding/permease protein [Chitinasiproducens palmae]
MIDQHTRRKLFGKRVSPLGKVILIDTLPCVVIGVKAETRDGAGDVKQLNVWLPYTTALARLFGQQHLDSITVRVRDGQPGALAEKSLTRVLRTRHGRQDFFTYNVDSIARMAEQTARSLTLLLSLIAVISLLVGGIGVMNIMLVSVTERTREIGVRMAVGARRRDVLQQFLVEALLVCVASGVAGVALSLGIGWLVSWLVSLWLTQWQLVYSVGAVASALASATATGVLFGYAPARRAARMLPVDALSRD